MRVGREVVLWGSLSHLHLERESEGSLTDVAIKRPWRMTRPLSLALTRLLFAFPCGRKKDERERWKVQVLKRVCWGTWWLKLCFIVAGP